MLKIHLPVPGDIANARLGLVSFATIGLIWLSHHAVVPNAFQNPSGSTVHLAAALCAFLDPHIGAGMFLAVTVLYLLPGKLDAVLGAGGSASMRASSGALE